MADIEVVDCLVVDLVQNCILHALLRGRFPLSTSFNLSLTINASCLAINLTKLSVSIPAYF